MSIGCNGRGIGEEVKKGVQEGVFMKVFNLTGGEKRD